MKSFLMLLILGLTLSGCATPSSTPEETSVSIELNGSAVEVQNFIEETISRTYGKEASGLKVVSADDRSITFQTDCMNVYSMGAFKCTMILMAIGNTGWDGPFLTIIYRTNEIHETTIVRSEYKYCATNILGKINCGLLNIPVSNQNLLELKSSYEKKN
jgi:hypothetical protein